MLLGFQYFDELRKFQRSTSSSTIKNVFNQKQSILQFARSMSKWLSRVLMVLKHNEMELINAVKKRYKLKEIDMTLVDPKKEVKGYEEMVMIGVDDWNNIIRPLTTLVNNPNINPSIFYNFINECADKAVKQNTSFVITLGDIALRAELNEKIANQPTTDNSLGWIKNLFPTYDEYQIMKRETAVLKYAKASSNEPRGYNNNNNNNYNDNGRPRGRGAPNRPRKPRKESESFKIIM